MPSKVKDIGLVRTSETLVGTDKMYVAADAGNTDAQVDLVELAAYFALALGVNTEAVQDIVGALLAAGTGLTVTYNDVGAVETISIDAATMYTKAQVDALLAAFGGTGSYESAPSKPVAANFTLTNGGTASFADGNYGVVLTMPSSTINVRFLKLTAGPPATPYSLIGRSSMITPYQSGNIHHGCLIVRNSVSGKAYTFGASGSTINITQWSNLSTFNASIAAISANFGREGFWKRIRNDGVNLFFDTSSNGVDWGQVATVTLASYIGSVDEIGFGSVNGAASGLTNLDLFESFVAA